MRFPRLCLDRPRARETFAYASLPEGKFIRYIELQPGNYDDRLICSLHMSGVDSAAFEAISYVWGTHSRNETIICDGKRLRITENLRTALQRVRLQGGTRRIWADSICINQEDPNERGHQVALMGDI